MKTRLVVPDPPWPDDAAPGTRGFFRSGVHTIVVGKKTNSVFFTKLDRHKPEHVHKADVYSGRSDEAGYAAPAPVFHD